MLLNSRPGNMRQMQIETNVNNVLFATDVAVVAAVTVAVVTSALHSSR